MGVLGGKSRNSHSFNNDLKSICCTSGHYVGTWEGRGDGSWGQLALGFLPSRLPSFWGIVGTVLTFRTSALSFVWASVVASVKWGYWYLCLIFPCPKTTLSYPFLSPQTSNTLSPSLFWADGLASYSTKKIKAIRKELLHRPAFNLPTYCRMYQSEHTVPVSSPITCDLDFTPFCHSRTILL